MWLFLYWEKKCRTEAPEIIENVPEDLEDIIGLAPLCERNMMKARAVSDNDWIPLTCSHLILLFPSFCPLFSPLRNQAMRKKLILYFKRRNHARKQWVSIELHIFDSLLALARDRWLVWKWASCSLKCVAILGIQKKKKGCGYDLLLVLALCSWETIALKTNQKNNPCCHLKV